MYVCHALCRLVLRHSFLVVVRVVGGTALVGIRMNDRLHHNIYPSTHVRALVNIFCLCSIVIFSLDIFGIRFVIGISVCMRESYRFRLLSVVFA